jgi:hypothetical protein
MRLFLALQWTDHAGNREIALGFLSLWATRKKDSTLLDDQSSENDTNSFTVIRKNESYCFDFLITGSAAP